MSIPATITFEAVSELLAAEAALAAIDDVAIAPVEELSRWEVALEACGLNPTDVLAERGPSHDAYLAIIQTLKAPAA